MSADHLQGTWLRATQERYLVEQLGAPGFYHVIARYGYTQRVVQVRLQAMLLHELPTLALQQS